MLLKTGTLLISDLRFNRHVNRAFLILFTIILLYPIQLKSANNPGQLLQKGRELFYASVEDKSKIKPAIDIFKLLQSHKELAGRAQVYIGALTALRGKHSLLPHSKWKWANRGLDIMDEGLTTSPQDAEALFIHSSTCYFLPFFFKRGDEAQQHFKQILDVLPEQIPEYNPELVNNMLDFIDENAKLDASERQTLEQLKNGIGDEL